MRRNESSFTLLQAAAAVAAAADGMAFDRPKNENDWDNSTEGNDCTTHTTPQAAAAVAAAADGMAFDRPKNENDWDNSTEGNDCTIHTTLHCVNEAIAPIVLPNTAERNCTTTKTAINDNYNSILNYLELIQPKYGNEVAKFQSVKTGQSDYKSLKMDKLNYPACRIIPMLAEDDSSAKSNTFNKNESAKSFKILDRNCTGLRRGKWTPEEEQYALYLIQLFKSGMLPLSEGVSLRTFLSTALNCDPMRISKKFVGSNCIGKQVFRYRDQDANHCEIVKHCRELGKLKEVFLSRIQREALKDPPVNKPKRRMNLKRPMCTRDDSPTSINAVLHVPIDQDRVLSKRIQPSKPNWVVPFNQGSITEDIHLPNGGDVGHAENGMGEYFNFAIKSSLGGRNVGAQEVHDKRGMKTVCSVPSMHMAEVMNSLDNSTTDELESFMLQMPRTTSPPIPIPVVPCAQYLRPKEETPATSQPIVGYGHGMPLEDDVTSCNISRNQ